MTEVNEAIVEKIKKLLALGDTSKNTNEAEAEQALLMAQKLMAKYGVEVSAEDMSEKVEYSFELAHHEGNKGFRITLCNIIARNFRCKAFIQQGVVAFFGHKTDAVIAKNAFEFAYKFAKKNGDAQVRAAKRNFRDTKQIFNSYVAGFLNGLNQKLSQQCTALMIVTPKDVIDEADKRFTNRHSYKGGMIRQELDHDVYQRGLIDGQRCMFNEQVEE